MRDGSRREAKHLLHDSQDWLRKHFVVFSPGRTNSLGDGRSIPPCLNFARSLQDIQRLYALRLYLQGLNFSAGMIQPDPMVRIAALNS